MKSFKYKRGELSVIDQLKLPEVEWVSISNCEETFDAIASMNEGWQRPQNT